MYWSCASARAIASFSMSTLFPSRVWFVLPSVVTIILSSSGLFPPAGEQDEVLKTMKEEHLGYRETAERFGIYHKRVMDWERIYLEEGPEGLYIERRGRSSKGRPPKKLKPEVEEDLLAEVQRLRAENAYLKKLNALVAERVRQERKQK